MKRSARSPVPLLMILTGVALIVGSGLWYLRGGDLFGDSSPAEAMVVTEEVGENPARVGLADAKAAFETGSAVFVDVRDAQYYAQGHVQGALSIPLEELSDRLDELNTADWIITYCT